MCAFERSEKGMEFKMKVLITGASSGIGKDMAKVLAEEVDELVLVARDLTKLEMIKKELDNKVKVEIVSMDLSIEENCKELHRTIQNVDILINNAGFGDCGEFNKTSL